MTSVPLPSKLYAAAVAGSLAFAVLHLLSLPMLMTYDGADYVRLGVGWPRNFPAEWDFARTPLYPLTLRVSFWLLGRQALGAMLPNVVFAFIGTWAIGSAVRRVHGPRLAAAAIAVLSLFPTLVVYQHSVLTEAGSFMFLGLLVNWITWRPADLRRKTGALVVGIVALFAFRPTSLALVPLAAVFLAFDVRARAGNVPWRQKARVLVPHLLAVGVVTALLPTAWQAASGGLARDYQGQQIMYGLLKQVVFPPDDPLMAPVREAYLAAIADATVGGWLDNGGLRRGPHVEIYRSFESHEDPRAVLIHAIAAYPGRYVAGVARASLLNVGGSTINSENADYFRGVVLEAHTGSKLMIAPGQLAAELEAALRQPSGKSMVGGLLEALDGPFRVLLWFGAAATLLGLGLGLFYRRSGLVAFSAVPVYWSVVHSLTLTSSDRLVVPSFALFVVNAVVLPGLFSRARRHLAGSGAPPLQ